jgi:hypothetical protein
MALGKNIVITADTQQAIAEINKLDVSQSNLIANTAKMMTSLTGVGAILGGITALTGGVLAMAASFTAAEVASAVGGGNLQKLTQETGGLIASQALLAAQTRLTGQGLGQYTGILGKAATVMSDQLGISEEEALGQLTKMLVTGKKLERGMAQLGVEFKSTGDKAKDQAALIELLTKKFGDITVKAGDAEERMKAYNSQMAIQKAAALNSSGEVGNWEAITMSVTRTKDAMVMLFQTGLTIADSKRLAANAAMVQTINDETA